MINAGLERQQDGVVVSVTRTFRENNQGVACVQRVFHLFGNRLWIIAMTRNQQGIENVLNDEAFEFARQPVIRTGDWARGQAPEAGQGNPHQHKIAMTAVIGIIDLLVLIECQLARAFGAYARKKRDRQTQGLVGQPGKLFFEEVFHFFCLWE